MSTVARQPRSKREERGSKRAAQQPQRHGGAGTAERAAKRACRQSTAVRVAAHVEGARAAGAPAQLLGVRGLLRALDDDRQGAARAIANSGVLPLLAGMLGPGCPVAIVVLDADDSRIRSIIYCLHISTREPSAMRPDYRRRQTDGHGRSRHLGQTD
jgi:hypothetical protein